jgi:hypothetical protein
MEDTLSTNMLLTPVETLKERHLEEFGEYNVKEYRLKTQPDSLKDFVDLFFKENGEILCSRIIWIGDGAFVRIDDLSSEVPQVYKDSTFRLELKSDPPAREVYIHSDLPALKVYIHSSTLEDAISCLDLLVGLQDDHYKEMWLFYNGQYPFCPLPNRVLEKLLCQHENRLNAFYQMSFTSDQCRILATSGTRTNILFIDCWFQHGGVAFLEALATREDVNSGPAKLSISERLPFNQENFVLLMNRHRFERLTLWCIRLNTVDACEAVAAADLQYLHLESCSFVDGGAALVESVRQGRGPRGFHFDWDFYNGLPFDSLERYISFMNALGGNLYVERLHLSNVHAHHGIPQALAASLRENRGLTHLSLRASRWDDRCWSDLLEAVSTHPSLHTLAFKNIHVEGGFPFQLRKAERTKAVADMLLVNKRIDEIPFDEHIFDGALWNTLVAPKLECNLYRKRFVPLQKIEVPSTRAAIVARVLARVERKPWLVWMALSQNCDVLFGYLDDALSRDDSASVTSLKRSRSSSGGDI